MKIEHLGIYFADLEAARAFFERYFAAVSSAPYHNPRTQFRSYFLTFDGGSRLEIMSRPALAVGPDAELHLGQHHFAFSLGSAAAVDSLTARLAADGFATMSGPRTTGDGYYESCVRGPEGIFIELTE